MESIHNKGNQLPDNQTDANSYAYFDPNRGCIIDGCPVSNFYPEVTAVHEQITPDGHKTVSYEVSVTDKSGKKLPPFRVANVTKIDWLTECGIYDVDMTRKDEKLLAAKLLKDIAACKNRRREFLAPPGFHLFGRMPVISMGKQIITPDNADDTIKITAASTLEIKARKNTDLAMAKTCINFMPGVTELLFYASLLGAVKPLLNYWGVVTDFIIALIAPSGHLKTTLARLYALWLSQREAQEISFSDTIRNDKLQHMSEECAAQNFLIDDYHTVSKAYTKNRYRDRLDHATRIVSGSRNSANIFITAESLKDSVIFSAADRMLQIHIGRMAPEELSMYKDKLSEIPDDAMPRIALAFVQKILNDFEQAGKTVSDFLDNFETPAWCKGDTRMGNQYKVILLVELLFRTYMCNNDLEISAHIRLGKALQEHGKRQLKQLDLLRREDTEYNFLLILDEIIKEGTKSTDINIVIVRGQYDETTGSQALLEGNFFYITGNALLACMRNHIGYPSIRLHDVSSQLHDAGVLMEDTDKRTKKFLTCRHYVIALDALKQYCEMLRSHSIL